MSEATKKPRPSPRAGVTWEVEVGGQKIFLRSGEYEDGTLCEVWVTAAKQGALLQALLDGFSIAVSLALQHGVPLKQYVDAYTHTKFDPCGPVTGDPDVKWASSLFDYIFQRLSLNYGTGEAARTEPQPSPTSAVVGGGPDNPLSVSSAKYVPAVVEKQAGPPPSARGHGH